MARTDVIIPVKNSPWWVDWCLTELYRCSSPEELADVLVVDDGSTSDSAAALAAICGRYPQVRLVRNPGRPGFGSACNFGISLGRAPLFLLLNTDCLLTPGLLRKLGEAVRSDPTIGLVSPLSNNSPVLTLPLLPGLSYLDMNELLERATEGQPMASLTPDACTVVGNCLLITRQCWEATGEFDPVWGLGYGEETDFQFRAMARGYRGVALINAFVYHFGSASFRYESGVDQIKARALTMFHSKWGREYEAYAQRCEATDPVQRAQQYLESVVRRPHALDVLIVLPAVFQGVGGIHAAVDLCNHLIRRGLRAACAILGAVALEERYQYQEVILFGLLRYLEEEQFVAQSDVSPRTVVATLFSTATPARALARSHHAALVNWIQGYEFYFENGMRWRDVEDAYGVADCSVATSTWLEAGARRHVPNLPVTKLSIGVNLDVFFPAANADRRGGSLTVAVVLRDGPDKGQWILQEMMHRLWDLRDQVTLVLLRSPRYRPPRRWASQPTFQDHCLPLDRESIASVLRSCDVLVDASLHEGFGLMALEAMACGATVVLSASGGVGEFVRDGENALLVTEALDPERYIEQLTRLLRDPALLATLKAGAARTARAFDVRARYDAYVSFFREHWFEPTTVSRTLLATGEARAYDELQPIQDLLMVRRPGLRLVATGEDPSILLPSVSTDGHTVLKVDITAADTTDLQVFVPASQRGWYRWLRRAAKRIRNAIADARSESDQVYQPETAETRTLHAGENVLYVSLPPLRQPGRVRLDPTGGRTETVVHAIEIRRIDTPGIPEDRDQLRRAFNASSDAVLRLDAAGGFGGLDALKDVTLLGTGPGLWATGPDARLLLPTLTESEETLFIVEIDSPAAGALALVREGPDGTGDSERQLVERTLVPGANEVRILLARPKGGGRYRLDITGTPGEYHLRRLTAEAIVTRGGESEASLPSTPRASGGLEDAAGRDVAESVVS